MHAALFVLLLVSGIHGEEFPLRVLVEKALAHSAAIQAANAEERRAHYAFREAQDARFPRLSARAGYTRGDDPVYVFGSLLDQGRFGPQNFQTDSLNYPPYLTNFKTGVDISLPLFSGFDLSTRAKLSRLGYMDAVSRANAQAEQLRMETIDASLQTMLKRETVEMLDRRIASGQKAIEAADKLKARGLVLGSDYYAAEAILKGLSAWRKKANAELDVARRRLTHLTGDMTPTPAGELTEKVYELTGGSELTAAALSHREDLKQVALEADAAKAVKFQADLLVMPRVEAFASYETNTLNFDSNPSRRIAGVRAELPIGDISAWHRRARARAGADAGAARRQSMEDAVREDVAEAKLGYQSAVDILPEAKDALNSAERSLDLLQPLYREGRQSVLEALRAEDAAAHARAAYLESLYGVHAGYAKLLFSTAQLDEMVVGEIQAHLERVP